MNRTAEVNRRSQVEEYLSEEVIRRCKLESGSSKREFCLWCVSNVGGTLLGSRTRTRTQGELK